MDTLQKASRIDNLESSKQFYEDSVCPHDCPDACSLTAKVEGLQIVRLAGQSAHPITRGFLCVKAPHFVERIYHPDRILYPMARRGRKGSDAFERISWTEAVEEIARRFKSLIAGHGGECILPYSYSGTLGKINNEGMDRRFFNRLGATKLLRTICTSAGEAAYRYTVGRKVSSDIESIPDSALIVLWGNNVAETGTHFLPLLKQAKAKGATVVAVDPRKSRTTKMADWHIQPRPGTDVALALAMIHVIIGEELYDRNFVEKSTFGFDELSVHVKSYSPDWAESITGVPAEEIRTFARRYATEQPSFICCGWGVQRHSNGGMAVRAIICLPGLTGSWMAAGGGMYLSNSEAIRLNTSALQRPDLTPGNPRSLNMVELADVLLEAKPPVYGLYVYDSNPAAVAPDQRRVTEGLMRDDLFTVVHEIFKTDTAAYADILLPATTPFEEWDLIQSHGIYLALNKPTIPPRGEAKSNTEVFRLLAKAMEFTEACFEDSDLDLIEQLLDSEDPALKGITFERLMESSWVRADVPAPYMPFPSGDFFTPSGKLEFYSTRMQSEGQPPLPTYEPDAESREGSPDLHARYPLSLISPASRYTISTSFANLALRKTPEEQPTVQINPLDAVRRNIQEGDPVRLFNDRGSCMVYARVTEDTPPGVVVSRKGRWAKLSPGGHSINQLTSTRLADLGGGATFHSTLVEAVRADVG